MAICISVRSRRALIALAALLAVPRAYAASGTSGAAFLKLAPGAGPAGMGEAYSAVSGDVQSVYYNPAGLAEVARPQITGMHDASFQGIRYEFAALALPLLSFTGADGPKNSRGVIAAAVYNLSVSGLERRGTVETDAPTGTFASSDLAYSLAYAYGFTPELSAGAAVKFVDQTLDSVSATALAVDAGATFKHERWSLAGGVRNAGSAPKFREAADPLPFTAYAGASRLFGGRWLTAADLLKPRDQPPGLALGVQYSHPFDPRLTGLLRAGFNTLHRDSGGLSGVSLGGGVEAASMRLDFAWLPMGDLGNTFRYSVSVRF